MERRMDADFLRPFRPWRLFYRNTGLKPCALCGRAFSPSGKAVELSFRNAASIAANLLYPAGEFVLKSTRGGRLNMSKIYIPSLADRRAKGKKLRDRLPRVDQAIWKPEEGRDILATIRQANVGRVPKLIPMKMGRMSVSPFAFFRGAAPLMARDLSGLPTTGLGVQICGDAHVKNLGAYAAPDPYRRGPPGT